MIATSFGHHGCVYEYFSLNVKVFVCAGTDTDSCQKIRFIEPIWSGFFCDVAEIIATVLFSMNKWNAICREGNAHFLKHSASDETIKDVVIICVSLIPT